MHPSGPRESAPHETSVETVTHAHVTDLPLPDGAGTLALVTLANGTGRPTTLGPRGLANIGAALTEVAGRARAGQVTAVAITGTPPVFAAGADLDVVLGLTDRTQSRAVAELGHATLRLLGEMPVPTFAFLNGAALGGGLEIALHCTYRTAASDVRSLGLPEVRLGLVPGWGGCWLLPRLVGVEAALDVICRRALAGRMTTAVEAHALGLVDHLVDPARLVADSVAWVAAVLQGADVPRRPLDDEATWDAAVAATRADLERRLHGAAPAAVHAVDLVAAARTAGRDEAFAAEDDVLTELLVSPELRAGVYVQRATARAGRGRPAAAPDAPASARGIRSVGVVGGGLMASQLAVLLASRLQVPVAMREVDGERAEQGRARVRAEVDGLVRTRRLDEAGAQRLLEGITLGTDLGALGSADLVIEAVTEVMAVKQQVFAELEALVAPDAILATNTSALSVTTMGARLVHQERVVGLHFFNPVSRMPLVEVVRTEHTDGATRATGLDVARRLGKTAVEVLDRPGFVVNRLLLRLLGDVLACVEDGTPATVADAALRPLGLPMGPFTLLQLVGPAVAGHVLTTLHDELGDRFRLSPGLARLAADGRPLVAPGASGEDEPQAWVQAAFGEPGGPIARDAQEVLDHVLSGLTEEIGALLGEGVVAGPEDVDVCMVLGAGWPYHLGGITPYLDRTGWSERLLGQPFATMR